jgi:hypothetical protein
LYTDFSDNNLGIAGWRALTDVLEHITSITSLNGCDQIAAIRAGGMVEMRLAYTGRLSWWAARYFERSAATLTILELRCV